MMDIAMKSAFTLSSVALALSVIARRSSPHRSSWCIGGTPVDLAKLAPPKRPCGKNDDEEGEEKGFRVELEQCPGLATKELPMDALRGSVEVKADAKSETDVEIRYITFFGKVTRGKKPAHVRVFGAVTDPETGEYVAIVRRLPPMNTVPFTVDMCDGGPEFWYLPETAPADIAA